MSLLSGVSLETGAGVGPPGVVTLLRACSPLLTLVNVFTGGIAGQTVAGLTGTEPATDCVNTELRTTTVILLALVDLPVASVRLVLPAPAVVVLVTHSVPGDTARTGTTVKLRLRLTLLLLGIQLTVGWHLVAAVTAVHIPVTQPGGLHTLNHVAAPPGVWPALRPLAGVPPTAPLKQAVVEVAEI